MPVLPLKRFRAPGVPLPWWVTVLDILGVLLPLLALNAFFTGGFRYRSDLLVLSLTSWQRLTFWSVAVLTLRHLLVPRPALTRRLAAWRARPEGHGWPVDALAIGVITRLTVLMVGYFAVIAIGGPADSGGTTAGPMSWTLPPGSEAWRHLQVARDGYSAGGPDAPVFPALGVLIRCAAWTLAVTPLLAGLLIAVGSFVAAMAYMYRLARHDMGHEAALVSMVLLGAFPWSLTHSLVSVEPLYLLALVGAFCHARRGEWLRASCWGVLLGLTRPGGFLVALPLALAARLSPGLASKGASGLRRTLLPALAPIAGLVIAVAYSGGWTRIFGTTPSPAVLGPSGVLSATGSLAQLVTVGLLPSVAQAPFGVLDALSAVFAVALVWPVTRRLGPAYGLFVAVALLSSLLFGGEGALGRQAAVAFPLFLWMGATVPASHRFAWISLFAMMQALAAVLFFTWRGQW